MKYFNDNKLKTAVSRPITCRICGYLGLFIQLFIMIQRNDNLTLTYHRTLQFGFPQ